MTTESESVVLPPENVLKVAAWLDSDHAVVKAEPHRYPVGTWAIWLHVGDSPNEWPDHVRGVPIVVFRGRAA